MPLLQSIILPNGKRGLISTSDEDTHWYNFFTSLEIEDLRWLQDALSLKRAFEDVKAGRLSSHEEVQAEMEDYYDQGYSRLD